MEYHLKNDWNVTVSLEVTHDGTKYNFCFDFITSTSEEFGEIIQAAKTIIRDKFGHRGYKITHINLKTQN